MPSPLTYSFTRYLSAKKSVDDRALNQHVWQSLAAALPRATLDQPLQILEVGAGLGTMVERLFAGAMLTNATYTAIDMEPTLIAEARRRLSQWATAQGLQVQPAHLITHRFPLTQAAQAYAMLDQHPEEALQVLLTYEG